jgi:ABC-type Co2+ transport system permease subunit
LRRIETLSHAVGVARLFVALLLVVVAVELVMVIGLAAGLVLLGSGPSIAVGAGMAFVALVSVVVCWRVARRG